MDPVKDLAVGRDHYLLERLGRQQRAVLHPEILPEEDHLDLVPHRLVVHLQIHKHTFSPLGVKLLDISWIGSQQHQPLIVAADNIQILPAAVANQGLISFLVERSGRGFQESQFFICKWGITGRFGVRQVGANRPLALDVVEIMALQGHLGEDRVRRVSSIESHLRLEWG